MLTKEKYQKELVRMWDSLRIDIFKGRTSCDGVRCDKCPLKGCCRTIDSFETIDRVEKWSKEHPQKVKKERFFESFDETVVFMFADIVGLTNVISVERCLCDSNKWRWKLTYTAVEK